MLKYIVRNNKIILSFREIIMKHVWDFFTFWTKIRFKYERLSKDEEKKKSSIKLGIWSICETLVGAIITALALWGMLLCVNAMGNNSFILPLIGAIVTAVLALTALVRGIIGGLLYMIYQLKLNKRAIGYIALALWLLAIGAVIAVVIVVL